MELIVGIKNLKEIVVDETLTAVNAGSGLLDVYGTPYMIALMENCAHESIERFLEEGMSTVGSKIDVKHMAPTPIGMKVFAETELIQIDGRKLVFSVNAYDEKDKIGEGIHERFIIHSAKFKEKTLLKLQK